MLSNFSKTERRRRNHGLPSILFFILGFGGLCWLFALSCSSSGLLNQEPPLFTASLCVLPARKPRRIAIVGMQYLQAFLPHIEANIICKVLVRLEHLLHTFSSSSVRHARKLLLIYSKDRTILGDVPRLWMLTTIQNNG